MTDAMVDALGDIMNHIDHDHADTVAMIGRYLVVGRVSCVANTEIGVTASIGAVDEHGIDVVVSIDGQGATAARHDFEEGCSTVDDARIELLSLLQAARDWVGSEFPLTSLERELTGTTYPTFLSEVVAVTDITPTLRQITFGGGLDDFESLGGDQFFYVLLPPRGRTDLTVGVDFSWLVYEEMPASERPAGAYYTVRRWRPDARELDVWFVLHGDAGASSAWASRAEPGQPVGLWGPRRTFDPPVDTRSYLFVVDETGFGAAAASLDAVLAVDPHAVATVIAEHDADEGRIDFPTGPGVAIVWVDRAGQAPGTSSQMLDAVRAHDLDGDVYAFGAAESRRITDVRKYLRHDVGLDASHVSMTGYWRST